MYKRIKYCRLHNRRSGGKRRLMHAEELADYLEPKELNIYTWLLQMKLRGVKAGGVWKFDRKEIDSWLRQ
jgi:excisionase family DNA binding protein